MPAKRTTATEPEEAASIRALIATTITTITLPPHTHTHIHAHARTPLLSIIHSRHRAHARWWTPARTDPTPFPCVTPPNGPIRGRIWGPGLQENSQWERGWKSRLEESKSFRGPRSAAPAMIYVSLLLFVTLWEVIKRKIYCFLFLGWNWMAIFVTGPY